MISSLYDPYPICFRIAVDSGPSGCRLKAVLAEGDHGHLAMVVEASIGGVPKMRGSPFGSPYNKGHSILGSISGPSIYGNFQIASGPATELIL